MTKNQQNYKRQLIQKIQISKHNVFYDDEQRKEFIKSRFGVDSTTKMNIDELKLLLDFCNKKVSDIKQNLLSGKQKELILTLWDEKGRDKNEVILCKFASRIAVKEIQSVDDIQKNDATKIILALKNMKG